MFFLIIYGGKDLDGSVKYKLLYCIHKFNLYGEMKINRKEKLKTIYLVLLIFSIFLLPISQEINLHKVYEVEAT